MYDYNDPCYTFKGIINVRKYILSEVYIYYFSTM